MTHNIHTLLTWIRVVAVITSVCASSLPITYAIFFNWRARLIGKLFMWLAATFAVAIDLSTLFSFWRPADILWRFWIDAIVFTAIAASSLALSLFMIRLRFPSKKGKTNAAQR